jgi:hypothetical protein
MVARGTLAGIGSVALIAANVIMRRGCWHHAKSIRSSMVFPKD